MCFIQMCFIISETWKRGAGGGASGRGDLLVMPFSVSVYPVGDLAVKGGI